MNAKYVNVNVNVNRCRPMQIKGYDVKERQAEVTIRTTFITCIRPKDALTA